MNDFDDLTDSDYVDIFEQFKFMLSWVEHGKSFIN